MVLLSTLLLFVVLAAAVAVWQRRQQARRRALFDTPAPPPRPQGWTQAAGLPGEVRHLSVEELAGVAANLYAARGYQLVRQELGRGHAELLVESPSHRRLLVRCVRGDDGWVDTAHVARTLQEAHAHRAKQAVLLTAARFSGPARATATRRRCELVDGARLLLLLRRHLPGATEALRLVRLPMPPEPSALEPRA